MKDNKVEWDPLIERVMLDSGKPLVLDCYHLCLRTVF